MSVPLGDVRLFGSLDSTNRYLLAEAEGLPDGLVVVADHQRAGRGRLGRTWESPPGSSLLASVLLRPALAPTELHLCSLAVALAACRACEVAAGVEPWLKWPNDLVVADRKLAGVLAESVPGVQGAEPALPTVVVGVGINVDWPGPQGAGGACLRELAGRAVDRLGLLFALLASLAPLRADLDRPGGRAALVAAGRARCATLGRLVVVDTGAGMVEGRAVDLTDEGHLVVATPAGHREVAAGDVVHVRPGRTSPQGG
ncbi:MAG TPA: biotin--[acetyl-CoA-carboxylase] ligase [Acidimicrobiales bacterium]|nr:biotin--[acetyl-CoA-carboxylase] ligase [Acidimicrobiales bacterium]